MLCSSVGNSSIYNNNNNNINLYVHKYISFIVLFIIFILKGTMQCTMHLCILCSCGSVVEHCVCSTKGCGFDSQETHIMKKMYSLNVL